MTAPRPGTPRRVARARAAVARAAPGAASRSAASVRRLPSRAARSGGAARPRPVGASVARREAPDKVTGRARYVDDLRVEGLLHGRTVRSETPRGRIVRVELDPAFDWRGVTVADWKNIPGENVVALIEDDQPLLARDEVRHAEEAILLVAHHDPERAEAARRAVRVTVEPLEPVLTIEASLAARVRLRGEDNVQKQILIERGDLEAAFAGADRVVEGEYRFGHQEHIYIENQGMLAERAADGTLVVRGSLQCPYYVHAALCRVFALPPERVRVIQTVTGGGFGGKEEYPSMIGGHAALLAWKSGRPVRVSYDRLEDIAATTKRHPGLVRVRAGVMADGTFAALDADIVLDGGAYVTLSPVVLSRGAIHAGGPYRWPAARIRARAVATSTPPNGAFRGFGAPQTQFAIECHVDRIAATLGLDPLEVRRRNAYVAGDVTPTGQVLRESVSAREVLERTAAAVRYAEARARIARENAAAAAAERAGRAARRTRRGLGLSLVHHGAGFTGSGEAKLASRAALEIAPDGRPRVLSASTEIGQGTITVFSQLVGEALGVPAEWVEVATPDTALVPNSGPTVASRTLMVVGGLLEGCARDLRAQLEAFAGRPLRDARDVVATARRRVRARGPLRIERRYRTPEGLSWDDAAYRGDAYPVFSYAACAVEVEVDLDTGETRVLGVTSAHDVGRAVHPVLVAGQIEGGLLQGLGWALLEEVRWKDGRVWNAQLTNYIVPTAADAPPMRTLLVENPFSGGPHGAKGVGELPMDAPAPAVIAALAHATGARLDAIPATPERLLAALAREAER
uniref:Xanthine dehydrogenase n=1 Tax=Eiseniibacteriota bacterium TaxID=2212470 RepID=A0A832I344_UNCEI